MSDRIRYVATVPAKTADGLTAAVYRQAKREMGILPEAVTVFSAEAELLTASWAAFREPLMGAGTAPRLAKEAVAATVSRLNECPYCVDAHTIMLYGGGAGRLAGQLLDGLAAERLDEYHDLCRWAEKAATATTAAASAAPFPTRQIPEYLGVTVHFHFLNRVINVLIDGTFLPGSARARRVARRVTGRLMARHVLANHAPGRAPGLPAEPPPLPADLAWAAGSPPIAAAFGMIAAATDAAARRATTPAVRDAVLRVVGAWRGEPMGPSSAWVREPLAGVPEADRPAARLALLTALAPFQVTEGDVATYRAGHPRDADLLGLVSWSAFTAARTIGAWTPAARPAAPAQP